MNAPRRKRLHSVNMRVNDELFARMKTVSEHGPYKLTYSQIAERGIELAVSELEEAHEKEAQTHDPE